MEHLLGESWRHEYPCFLSKEEKACLRQALLIRLQNQRYSLSSYLADLRIINDYPELEQN